MSVNKFPNGCARVGYPEGTVGALIELLKKEDPNKQVFYVESHYDDYSCGDGYHYNFSQLCAVDTTSMKDSVVLLGDMVWEHENKVPPNLYSLESIGNIKIEYKGGYAAQGIEYTTLRYLSPRDFSYEFKEDCLPKDSSVKVVTQHHNFKEVLVEMTAEQTYRWLLENDFVEEEDY